MPGLSDRCGFCGREFPFSIPRCGTCRKSVCSDCSIRMGGAVFCSRECSHAFFYGGDEDASERADGDDGGE